MLVVLGSKNIKKLVFAQAQPAKPVKTTIGTMVVLHLRWAGNLGWAGRAGMGWAK
jgi:hypothetical protein